MRLKTALLATAGTLWLSPAALAGATTSVPGCSGDWTNGACWVNTDTVPPSQSPPNPGDFVAIVQTSTITLSTSAQVSAIDILGTFNQSGLLTTSTFVVADTPTGLASFNLSGGSLTASGDEDMQGVVTQTGGSNTTSGTLRVLSNPLLGTRTGTYNLIDGTLSAAALQIGPATETGIFNQSGGSVSVGGPMEIGGPLNATGGLAGGNGTYNMSGGTLTVAGGQGVDEVIGGFGTGTFSQTGGTHTDAASMTLGLSAGGVGNYTLDQADRGNAASLSIGTDLVVGDAGSGGFTHNGGTNTVTGSLTLGKSAGGVGTYLLAQPQASIESSLSVGKDLVIGDAGMGTFTQTGGSATVGGTMTLGKSAGGNGIYNFSQANSLIPSALTVTGDAIIGDNGFGSFTHTGGSITVNGTLTLGNGTGSGTYSMSEADAQTATELTTGSNLMVGNAGIGTFTQAGGSVTVGDVLVLGGGGGTGNYTMTGSTSTLDADHEIIVNGTFSQSDGKNSIDQGKITTGLGGTLTINVAGNYNLSGGSLEVENTETIQGAFNQTGGSNGPDGGLTLAGGGYTLSGGTLTVGDDVSVFGGKFDQSGGAAHIGGSLTINSAAGTGSYALSKGTLLVTKDEVVGDDGTATFTHTGGTNTLVGGDLTLGKSAGGTGTYTLAQSGSQDQAVLQVGGNLIVGDAGTGTFVHSGGKNTVNGDLTLGNADTGVGTYLLSQANSAIQSLLQVAGNAIIGNSGTGTFTQTGGTATLAGDATLGAVAGGNGTLSLNQADSTQPPSLQIGGSLVIGDAGTGTVTLTAGAATVGGALTLGKGSGGSGTLTLNQSDPTKPASLEIAGAATIGDHGTGAVTLSGGAMSVSGAMTLGNSAGGNGGLTLAPADNNNPVALEIGGGLVVGNFGTGSVSQTGGSLTVGGSLTLGQSAGGSGSFTLGQSSGQNLPQLRVASNIVVGALGTGSLTETGGNLTASGSLTAGQGAGSIGTVTLGPTSGQSSTAMQIGAAAIIGSLGTGSFSQSAGTATIGGALTLGQGTTGKGTLTVAPASGQAAALTIGGNLVVGDLGTGTYDQTGGSATVGGSLIMGNGATGNGTATLAQGSGQSAPSVRIGGNAIIGALGTGRFSQSGGSNTISGAFTLGQSAGGKGSYSLSQAGLAGSSLSVGGNAVIGGLGTGSFDQSGGGATFGGSVTLGQGTGGSGSYALAQTSTLQIANGLIVGALGTGSVQQGGGVATVGGALTLGQSAGGSGGYSLTQDAAQLTVGGAVKVGDLGSGSIAQSGGAVLIGGGLTLGNGASGSGSYTLGPSSGLGTPSLSVGGDEIIGNLGSGTFTQTGGANTVGGTLTIAAGGGHGTYNFSSGAITAGLVVNNDTLSLTGNGTITSNLVNNGNATVTGGGTVALVGNAINTGSLSISGATLNTQGNVTNSGGAVAVGAPGSALVASGTYTQDSGSTLLHGGALAAGSIVNNAGTIGGTGTLQGNVIVNGGTVQVGASPDPLHVAGNYTQSGGRLTFEIDPNGLGGFLESSLVLDKGAAVAITGTTILLDFLNGADASAFFADGLLKLDTFFQVSNGDLFSQDFLLARAFNADTFLTNLPGDSISGFDPNTGTLQLAAGDGGSGGGGSTSVPEPPSILLMLSALAGFFLFAGRGRRTYR